MKFRLLEGGVYVSPAGTEVNPATGMIDEPVTYAPGSTIESDKDYCKLFPGRWERLPDDAPVAPVVQHGQPLVQAPELPAGTVPGPDTVVAPQHRAVATQLFPAAANDASLIVLGDEQNGYTLYEADTPASPINPIPLAKPAMDAFLADYTKPAV